jgi:CBS domain-containing protein
MRKMSDIVRNQDPVTLPPSATVREACQCMRERHVGAVLVTEDDRRLVGIFTGRDPSIACWQRERARPGLHWPRS